ncbi:HNH endonuclease [Achromobacter spanius]|uniref:HNH endonuclease n=1 Tax=Achromobacter spanius TaxID=217203 RepID=UPI00381D6F5C
MTNRTWSWDAYTAEGVGLEPATVMKLWSKRLRTAPDGSEVIEVWAPPPWKKPATAARRERRNNIDCMLHGRPTYAVLRHGEGSENTQRFLYDASALYKLNGVVTDPQGFELAVIERRVSVEEFISLHAENESDRLQQDLDDIKARYSALDKATTREALIQARLGQGAYREAILDAWGGACAVTGCKNKAVLTASHAMAWAQSNDKQRLDPCNGLPLIANLDRLFDRHLISFEPDTGGMLLSKTLSHEDRALLGIPAPLRMKPSPAQAAYLNHHLSHFLTKESRS